MILFEKKKDCCGCGACASACPQGAISMEADEYGFLYPAVDEALCTDCGICRETCAFQNPDKWSRSPIRTYAAVSRSRDVLARSASGGAFGALAGIVLKRGGRVYGCAYDGEMKAVHIGIDNEEEMQRLQGSKYVQSYEGGAFGDAAGSLSRGKWVLYTGTPCQIAGLRAFLGGDPERLVTADLVCYGVPSPAFFKGQVESLGKELGGRIVDFRFRDKENGWASMTAKVGFEKDGEIRHVSVGEKDIPYYDLFIGADIQRNSCHSCPFASDRRAGDFTIGDFWGIEKFHPDVETDGGVSVLLANSDKALSLMDGIEDAMSTLASDFAKASRFNRQLRKPVKKGARREKALSAWIAGGWEAVEDFVRTREKGKGNLCD